MPLPKLFRASPQCWLESGDQDCGKQGQESDLSSDVQSGDLDFSFAVMTSTPRFTFLISWIFEKSGGFLLKLAVNSFISRISFLSRGQLSHLPIHLSYFVDFCKIWRISLKIGGQLLYFRDFFSFSRSTHTFADSPLFFRGFL